MYNAKVLTLNKLEIGGCALSYSTITFKRDNIEFWVAPNIEYWSEIYKIENFKATNFFEALNKSDKILKKWTVYVLG
jgi:hypothetical protein